MKIRNMKTKGHSILLCSFCTCIVIAAISITSCGKYKQDNTKQSNPLKNTSEHHAMDSISSENKSLNQKEIKKIAQKMTGKSIEELITKIGKPDKSTLSPSCESEGEDGIYEWGEIKIYTQSEEMNGQQIIQDVK